MLHETGRHQLLAHKTQLQKQMPPVPLISITQGRAVFFHVTEFYAQAIDVCQIIKYMYIIYSINTDCFLCSFFYIWCRLCILSFLEL
uniref:Uncharacterized protein n=1 Tax=Octopus bimaculoides TaxID=37653 RepID=A0A0L8GDB5_OCTBM